MNDKTLSRKSKRLSWLLRHGAGEEGLTMDDAGWAPIDEVLAAAGCSRQDLTAVVAGNNKTRFQIDGDRIRASQGHSVGTMPVTREALERSWEVFDGGEVVFHGTHVEAVRPIAAEGIHAGARTHVHLAEAVDSRVGKRSNVHVLLEVSVSTLRRADLEVYRSPNGVVLVRHVPPDAIVGLRALTKRAKGERAALEALLSGGA